MIYKIGDLVEINRNSIKKEDKILEASYLDTSNLNEGFFGEATKYNLKKDKLPSRAKRKVEKNDILISTVRPNQKHYGFIEEQQRNYIVSTGFAVLSPNIKKVNPYYLYKFLTLKEVTKKLQMIAEDSTSAYPSIKPKDILDIEIKLPSLSKQNVISNFLYDIDQKVELNNSTIDNLEELAQTLFQRWFVDFEFPDENGNPYKSNGGKMMESELGMIPEGWNIKSLQDISEIQNGYAFKRKDYSDKGIKVLRTLNIQENGFLVNNSSLKYLPYAFYEDEKYYKQRLEKFDVLLVMVGATIGKQGIVLTNNLPSLQNQNMWRFRSKENYLSDEILYFYIKEITRLSMNWKSGSAREFFRKDSFAKKLVVIPPADILDELNSYFKELLATVNNLNSQNETLKLLRDTLLPKLLSGKIVIPEEKEATDNVPIS